MKSTPPSHLVSALWILPPPALLPRPLLPQTGWPLGTRNPSLGVLQWMGNPMLGSPTAGGVVFVSAGRGQVGQPG